MSRIIFQESQYLTKTLTCTINIAPGLKNKHVEGQSRGIPGLKEILRIFFGSDTHIQMASQHFHVNINSKF